MLQGQPSLTAIPLYCALIKIAHYLCSYWLDTKDRLGYRLRHIW